MLKHFGFYDNVAYWVNDFSVHYFELELFWVNIYKRLCLYVCIYLIICNLSWRYKQIACEQNMAISKLDTQIKVQDALYFVTEYVRHSLHLNSWRIWFDYLLVQVTLTEDLLQFSRETQQCRIDISFSTMSFVFSSIRNV